MIAVREMYEGKNIHYSPLDNKPLCSFSGKLCKQRRLNGYALCLRHVLEDPAAPFRQCTYMVRNKQQCTNPIHQSNTSQYCTSHMQHLGLLPVSTKASSKATKNGQHNHHSVEHSTRILSKLGRPSDLLPSSIVSAAERPKTAGDPYLFHEVDIKSGSTVNLDKGISRTVSSMPIARLYPELAEKLDLESKTSRLDGHKAVSLAAVSSQSQPLNHVSAPAADKQLKDYTRHISDVSRPAAASLPSVVCNQFPPVVTASSRSSVETTNTQNLTRLVLDPLISNAAAVSSPVMGYPWQTSASGGSAASMVHTSSQLLPQALQGLLNVTSAAQSVSLPCLKLQTPRTEVSVPTIRPAQNAPLLQSLCDPTQFETGRTRAKPCLPVVRPRTVLSRSTVEDADHVKSQPCMACMVRPRPRPNWRHKVDLRRRQKALHKTAWKLYSDHVSREDCNTDILPCGVDSSDEDGDLELQLPRQRLWSGLSSDEEEEHDFDLADEVAANIRRTKLLLLKSRERRRFMQLQLRHHGNQSLQRQQAVEDLALASAARHSSLSAAVALQMLLSTSKERHSPLSVQRTKPVDQQRRRCLHKGDDDVSCGLTALPFTNHCLRHIMYNIDQQLFSYCTAKFSDNTQCCVPVFDVSHELPLCHEHSVKVETHQQTLCDSKPKKQRKKTKPSALTRPPKKGKKKKKIQQKMFYLSTALPRQSEAAGEEPVAMDTETVITAETEESELTAQPLTSLTSTAAMAATMPDSSVCLLGPESNMPKDVLEDVFSLATNLELPIDTDQATKFLDEHDLHDVLNKMPDEAFDLLTGKNGEYSLTRDVDEAFTRAFADISKPFVVDSKDDSLTQFQAQSRLPDNMVSLNDEELMKHLANVLFCRSTTSPTYDFADSISELGGGLVSNDPRGMTQALSTSSPWGIDCDGVTAMSSDTKLTYSGVEAACMPNGIVDHHVYVTVSSLSSVSSVAGNSVSGLTHSAVASTVATTTQTVPASTLPSCTAAAFRCMSVRQMSEDSTVLSTPVEAGTSSLDSLLAPVLHIGSFPALPQVLVSSPSSVLVSTPAATRLPSLQTLPDVETLMKPSRRYNTDRPVVTSGLSALPLASIFTPFSTAFCPPPPASSSVVKMDHPLASATVLATVSVASYSTSTVCSSALPDTAVSSVVLPGSAVQLTAGQTVLLPSSLSSLSAASHSGT